MTDRPSSELGPDQLFDQRMADHNKALNDAREKLRLAWEGLGPVTPQIEAYASANAEVAGLRSDGKWLIAAQDTLSPSDREALAMVRENVGKTPATDEPKPSE